MPKFLILIYEDEAARAEANRQDGREHDAHAAFLRTHADILRGGAALQSENTAKSLRGNGNGAFTMTDGAFAETKEGLGGFYLIEAADLTQAVEVAKQVPARFGGVEVRPVLETG